MIATTKILLELPVLYDEIIYDEFVEKNYRCEEDILE